MATLRFVNPARAVNASVQVATESVLRTVAPVQPNAALWSEWQTCPTLEEPGSAFTGAPLTGTELLNISSFNGVNWTQPTTAGGCGVLHVEFDVSPLMDPGGAPFVDVTIEVAADATAGAGQSNITVALLEEPDVGRSFLRPLALTPSGTTPRAFTATFPHPPLLGGGPARFLDLVMFCPDGGYNLTVDEIRASFGLPDDPKSPQVVVASTGAPVWQFRGPGAHDARFGRTLEDAVGGTSAAFSSSGLFLDGTTAPLYVAAGAQVTSARVDLLPEPFTDSRANGSGVSTYTIGPLSGTSAPAAPQVEGFPISAEPLQGSVTLYGLVAHWVADAEQPLSSTSYGVGNFTAFERATAQTFTIVQDGAIEGLEIELADATGHPVGPLVLELHTVTAGVPDNTTIATGSINATAARSGGWVSFNFSSPVAVSAGQVLAAVLASPGSTATQTWDWRGHNGVTTDPYTAGSAFISTKASGAGPWAPQSNVDMAFRLRLRTAFNESLAPFVTPAGASGLPVRTGNYSGSLTGWTWSVPGIAIDFTPDFTGGGIWQVPVINGLNLSIEYRWDVAISYDILPRAVELGIGNRSAFTSIADLKHREVVDFTAELQAALAANAYTDVPEGANHLWLFPLRVHADGPANITLAGFDIQYGATVVVTGFAPALNTALATAPAGNATVDVALALLASSGTVRLSMVNVQFSQPPFSPSPVDPVLIVPEGAANFTVLDLLQWFSDDDGPLALTFTIDNVSGGVATAALFRSAIDADLTVTLLDSEWSGNFSVTARATDASGLFATRTFNITVVAVDDPPVFVVLPDRFLANLTGTYDLSAYLSDEDTPIAGVNISSSSVFTTVSGTTLTFDYRSAPANFTCEVQTVYANDGHSNVSAALRVCVNNGGRPVLTVPGPVPVVMGHNLTLALDGFAEDDVDNDTALTWTVVFAGGATANPGGAVVQATSGRQLFIHPVQAGEVDVNLSVRDLEGNAASATLRLHIVPDTPPHFITLEGSTLQLAIGGEIRLPISVYLIDPDDVVGNFTFNLAWGGEGGTAQIEGGDLVIRPVGDGGGSLNVTLTAYDPAGEAAAVHFAVVVEPSPPTAAGSLLAPLLFGFGALGIGALLLLSYRKGQKQRKPSLGDLEREEADIDEDEEGGAAPKDPALASLDKTDEDRMVDDLDRMEREAEKPKMQLPPVTIFGVPNAKASTLLLFYRDGRAITWGSTGSQSDEDTEAAQELGAALREFATGPQPTDPKEWTTLEREGRKLVVEARNQLVLGAVLTKGSDEAIVRVNMRAALDRIFDENADRLKRWDGSRKGLGGVDDVLESLLRRS